LRGGDPAFQKKNAEREKNDQEEMETEESVNGCLRAGGFAEKRKKILIGAISKEGYRGKKKVKISLSTKEIKRHIHTERNQKPLRPVSGGGKNHHHSAICGGATIL